MCESQAKQLQGRAAQAAGPVWSAQQLCAGRLPQAKLEEAGGWLREVSTFDLRLGAGHVYHRVSIQGNSAGDEFVHVLAIHTKANLMLPERSISLQPCWHFSDVLRVLRPRVFGNPWIHEHLLHRRRSSSNPVQLQDVDLSKLSSSFLLNLCRLTG